MTHDSWLLPSAWLTGLCGDGWLKSLHTTELHLSLTQHLPRKLFFLGTSQQSFLSHVHVTLPTDCMMIGRYGDCEMSGDINRLLMFTLHCTGVAILSSQCAGDSDTCADPHLPSQTCEEQITNRVVSCPPATGPRTRQTGHSGHCAMCWAGPGAAGRLRTFHNMLCSPALQ